MPTLELTLDLPGVSQIELFRFHEDPAQLLRLTPPAKRVRILERPEALYAGARVVLALSTFGIPMRWVSRIEAWEPPGRFVDVQVKGPFAHFRHEHLFQDGRLVDRVDYEVPLRALGGAIVDRLFVRPDLLGLFAFRHRVTQSMLQ